jgi:hypothetical protein
MHDPELMQEIIAYRKNRTFLDESTSALQNLGKFLRGVKLHTRELGGTCYECSIM